MRFKFLLFLLPLSIFAKPGYFEPWGKDSHLTIKKVEETPIPKTTILTKLADKVITFHQKVLSPIDGPRSNFRPTSSRYMQLAMQRYGFFKGYIMGCDRLLRENNSKWVYQEVTIDNITYNFDPAKTDKFNR